MTNSDIVSDISYISHKNLSDHETMVIKTNTKSVLKTDQKRTSYYTTKILDYNVEKMTSDQILKCKIFLESYDWTDINSVSLLTVMEEMLEKFCTKKGPKNATSDGTNFKSSNRIPRQTRLWLRKKSLASKALRKSTTIKSCR